MSDVRALTHGAALDVARRLPSLESLLSRGEQRRLVRQARDWYLEAFSGPVTRNGTCVVATAGPPGAGKSTALRSAVPDLSARLVIDPDIAKDFLARWCVDHGLYAGELGTVLPDGATLAPRELAPALQSMSTEVSNLVRREAFAASMDVVIEGTMATPAFGERLMISLAKADYSSLLLVSVETDRAAAHDQALRRWWEGRTSGDPLGGRLVLPETIDAAYGADDQSRCRANAQALGARIRAGETTLETVTVA